MVGTFALISCNHTLSTYILHQVKVYRGIRKSLVEVLHSSISATALDYTSYLVGKHYFAVSTRKLLMSTQTGSLDYNATFTTSRTSSVQLQH